MNKHSTYLLALLLAGCSEADRPKNSHATDQSDRKQSSADIIFAPNPALRSTAMMALNNCVASEVTNLVNAESGDIDQKLTVNIANLSVSSCDKLIDAAVNEHIKNLEATVKTPANDPKSAEIVRKISSTLKTRSLSDWRKIHTDMKIGFAKSYVRIAANNRGTTTAEFSRVEHSTKASLPKANACPAGKQGDWQGNIICEGGDPSVLAALPAWAKPPKKVKVSNTSVDPEGHDRGISYAARYDGPLSDIEPLYRAQVDRERGIQLVPQKGSTMLVGTKIGDTMSGTFLSLTPQQTGDGRTIVTILFFQSIPQLVRLSRIILSPY